MRALLAAHPALLVVVSSRFPRWNPYLFVALLVALLVAAEAARLAGSAGRPRSLKNAEQLPGIPEIDEADQEIAKEAPERWELWSRPRLMVHLFVKHLVWTNSELGRILSV